jgi:hypothetical protein
MGEYASKSIQHVETLNIGGEAMDVFSIEQDEIDRAQYAAGRVNGEVYVIQVEDDTARLDGRIEIVLDPGDAEESISERFVRSFKSRRRT